MNHPRGFASDNNAPVHPEIIAAIENANKDHCIAYGDDAYTTAGAKKLAELFGNNPSVYFVFTGTAANVLGLSTTAASYNAVICAETAHINVDECAAPEHFIGCKLLSLATPDGKLTPDLVSRHMHGFGFEHHAQPKVISVTQATEMGTVYTCSELAALADFAHRSGLLLHVDGARIANAAVSLGCSFKEMITDTGVDILSFGGTKNGLMYGEAIVFLKPGLDTHFKYLRKQGMQLASKMRYIGAQFDAYLSGDLWKRNALHANNMARLLEQEVRSVKGVTVTQKVQANGVFARVPADVITPLREEYFFYTWDEPTSEVRWMCSFDTTEEDVRGFASVLRKLVQ
ncbi:MAG: beta-eliminating lyase-related protein [Bacteroidales bacterium]